MKGKKTIIVNLVFICLVVLAFTAISQSSGDAPDPSKLGVDSAQQNLQDITVSKFEDAAFWTASMPIDQGFITTRRVGGQPADKVNLDAERLGKEAELKIPTGGFVLGVKIHFNKRGMNYFYVEPIQPIAIEGIVKTLSVWVIGRNFNHVLKVIVSDYYGDKKVLTMGKLNFAGWKKLTVAVPPHVLQSDYHFTYKNGLVFHGFKVECDLSESQGQYFIYFDDLSAVTDLFLETALDTDDIVDQW